MRSVADIQADAGRLADEIRALRARCAAALGVRPERGAALIRKLLEVYPELEDEPISGE